MTQPEYFESKDANKVCKFDSSIYGFKQASGNKNIWFDETIKRFEFIKTKCVYYKTMGALSYSYYCT